MEQIQTIFQRLSLGIIQAEEVLKKTEEINSSVEIQVSRAELIKLEVVEAANHSQNIESNIQQFYFEIQNIYNHIIQKLSDIPNTENLAHLYQELQTFISRLNEIQIKITEIDQNVTNCEQLCQNFHLSQQSLSQLEVDKQEIINIAQSLENRVQRVIDLQTDIEQVLTIGEKLETLNSELSGLAVQVGSNREILQRMQAYVEGRIIAADNSVWQLREEIEDLRGSFDQNYRDMKLRIQIQIKNQQRIDNWLLAITFSVAFLAITLVLGR